MQPEKDTDTDRDALDAWPAPQWAQVLIVILIVVIILVVFEYFGLGNAQRNWDRPMTPPESLYQPR